MLLLSLVFIIWELSVLINPSRLDTKMANIKSDLESGLGDKNWREFAIFNLIYFVWSIYGLFTDYHLLFLILVGFSIFSTAFIRNELDSVKRIKLRRIDAFISIIILFSILYNYFV